MQIRPKNITRYCEVDDNKEYVKNRDFYAIQMYVGYNKNRASLLIECTGSETVILTDDKGNDLVYTENGKEYVVADIIFNLGKILATDNC